MVEAAEQGTETARVRDAGTGMRLQRLQRAC